jgi:hypothetical protein
MNSHDVFTNMFRCVYLLNKKAICLVAIIPLNLWVDKPGSFPTQSKAFYTQLIPSIPVKMVNGKSNPAK